MGFFDIRKKGKTTYAEIPDLLQRKQPFAGNSMWAQYEEREVDVEGIDSPLQVYTVYSYSTIIACWDVVRGSVVSNTKYSVTTSRHQNLCRQWL